MLDKIKLGNGDTFFLCMNDGKQVLRWLCSMVDADEEDAYDVERKVTGEVKKT